MDGLKKSFSSNLDALIEKFRMETNSQSEEEFITTRRITTESPNKPPDMEPSHDIDRQITDLESLIKRLQDEISEMTNEANKPIDEDHIREWFTKEHYNLEDNQEDTDINRTNNTTKPNNMDSGQTNSNIFPVIIPNISMLNKTQQDNIAADDSATDNTASTVNLAAIFAETRKNFSSLWDDVDDEVNEKLADVTPSSTNATFEELKAEIIEKITNEANLE